jgi:hypothetical protein
VYEYAKVLQHGNIFVVLRTYLGFLKLDTYPVVQKFLTMDTFIDLQQSKILVGTRMA